MALTDSLESNVGGTRPGSQEVKGYDLDPITERRESNKSSDPVYEPSEVENPVDEIMEVSHIVLTACLAQRQIQYIQFLFIHGNVYFLTS